MSKIRARKETGKLYFDFFYRGQRCREQTALDDTPINRKRTQEVLVRIEAEMTLGTFRYSKYFPHSANAARFDGAVEGGVFPVPATGAVAAARGPTPTVAEFSRIFRRENSVLWRKNTQDWVDSIFNAHILPGLGCRPIGEVTREELLDFRVRLAEKESPSRRKLSNKSINSVMRLTRSMLAEAARRHKFVNPGADIKRLKVKKTDIFPFALGEVWSILKGVRPDYRNYFVCRFFTGMRSGEIHGLKWLYVDFDKREILVRETITKGRVEYTKTDGSQREIQMSQRVYDALKAQEAVTRGTSEYVFCSRDGTPLDNKNFTDRVWYPLLRHLGLKARKPYQTRHTCATLWLAAGENPEWVAKQLGHTNTEMLFGTYSRFIPNLTRKDGSAFERLLAGADLAPSTEKTHET